MSTCVLLYDWMAYSASNSIVWHLLENKMTTVETKVQRQFFWLITIIETIIIMTGIVLATANCSSTWPLLSWSSLVLVQMGVMNIHYVYSHRVLTKRTWCLLFCNLVVSCFSRLILLIRLCLVSQVWSLKLGCVLFLMFDFVNLVVSCFSSWILLTCFVPCFSSLILLTWLCLVSQVWFC